MLQIDYKFCGLVALETRALHMSASESGETQEGMQREAPLHWTSEVPCTIATSKRQSHEATYRTYCLLIAPGNAP